MTRTEAIVAAAGVGKRLGTRLRKPYLNLSGKPIIIHALKALSSSEKINSIIVVVNKFDKEKCINLIKKYNIKKIKSIIKGGKERSDSVYNGLRVLDKDTDIVLIHDGVRPFIDDDIIKNSINYTKKFGACVVGIPVKATIKKLQTLPNSKLKTVEKTIDRHNLWEIQTPQVFRKEIILKAYKKFGNLKVTDDAMLVEKLGVKVRVVFGSYKNIKITTSEDLVLAEAISKCA